MELHSNHQTSHRITNTLLNYRGINTGKNSAPFNPQITYTQAKVDQIDGSWENPAAAIGFPTTKEIIDCFHNITTSRDIILEYC